MRSLIGAAYRQWTLLMEEDYQEIQSFLQREITQQSFDFAMSQFQSLQQQEVQAQEMEQFLRNNSVFFEDSQRLLELCQELNDLESQSKAQTADRVEYEVAEHHFVNREEQR